MPSFASRAAHRAWLAEQSPLPRGFRVGRTRIDFVPVESGKPAQMTLTLLAADAPTPAFAALFTQNAVAGAPVLVGRRRLEEPALGAVLVNNKISNVCAPDGSETVERLCRAVASGLSLRSGQVLAASTGVIGWRLPVEQMEAAVPAAIADLQPHTILPAAEGIVTTDLYPKVRRAAVGAGSIVGIAKGAGMIEPNLATMLVYLLTDLEVPRSELRAALAEAADTSFNCLSVDSDTSTSDSVVALSSGRVPCPDRSAFRHALGTVCAELADDIVRNGEGVHHVVRVRVVGAPDRSFARGVGKAVVNSPLVQTAICGNDPNVGRLVMAVGKFVGAAHPGSDLRRLRLSLGGHEIFGDGVFRIDPALDARLVAHLRQAELYATVPARDGTTFRPPIDYPPHPRHVELLVDLGLGAAEATILGGDRSHEYVTENADYRS